MQLLYTLYGSLQLTLVLIFTYLLIIIRGINKMVDIVTNRVFDTFNKLAPKESRQNDSLSTLSSLKRFTNEQRTKRTRQREVDSKVREELLYDIKENIPPLAEPKRRPLMGLSCNSCTPTSRDSLVNKATKSLTLKNILEYYPAHNKNSLLQTIFSHLSQVHVLKKYEYPQVAGLVLQDKRLQDAIEKTAIQQFQDSDKNDEDFYQQLLKNNEKRARKLLHDMRSTLSDFLLRFTSWVLYKLLPCFLSAVVVHSGQVEMLKEAGNSGLPLIFLPLHRSHLDYILISFILFNNNVRSPLVAAGDNLRIPFFGSLLRGLGAFFIKRRIDPIMGRKDHVYKAVLHTYMNACLRAGHNIEFFLEGGRTRTGKPCMPKYGVLSVILDAFMDGTIEDALLVPVSVNYEKLVDGNFVTEQLGEPKEMETFGAAMKGIWHVLNSDYGMMRIDFNQPFSVRELVKTFDTSGKVQTNGMSTRKLKSNPSTTSLYGTDIVAEEHKQLVESISKHVIYDCAQTTAIMSTNALSFLLLNKFRKGATIEQLIVALDELRSDLNDNQRDCGFRGDSIDVIYYAMELLGPGLICKEKVNNEDILKPVVMLPNVIELTYYSNTVVTYYAVEAIVAMALNSLNTTSGIVRQDQLIEAALELCEIMHYEFILCKPCQSLEVVILDCIEDMIMKKEVFLVDDAENENAERGRRIARQYFEDSDEEDTQTHFEYKINNKQKPREYLMFLKNLLLPLIETYSVTSFCLEKLVERTLLESDLIRVTVEEIKNQINNGSIVHEESVSSDCIRNAFKLYQKWDILDCHAENKLRLYYLKDNHDNSNSIRLLCDRIDKYRYGFRQIQRH